ncbi:MAG: glycogen/starch synthase [Nanoarchaeota archaeon]|nr:glycogen/starch synthase [Nanoarchaeota archaeon]
MVFEVSFEVCNKVGGIYTVVSSKVPLMQAHYDNYFLIGPLFDTAPAEFIEERPTEPLAKIFSELAREGIKCKYGTWDILGRPNVILIDARNLNQYADDIKKHLWEAYQIDSYGAGGDFIEPMIWSWGVGKFLEKANHQFTHSKNIAHFHEWLSGFAILYLKDQGCHLPTVFTTHATMLGRSFSSTRRKLFLELDSIDPDYEAKQLGVSAKHTSEKAFARHSTVFSTVSDITAQEAQKLLGRKPEVLQNGLPIDLFPTFEESSYQHITNKKRLQQFLISHFYPYHVFDLNKTLFLYFGGRYEYENKGLDVIIEALSRLNYQLKEEGFDKTIVMFFFVAMNSGGPKPELLENKEQVTSLVNDLKEKSDYVIQQLLLDIITDDRYKIQPLPQDFIEGIRREFRFKKPEGNPPLCTHIIDEANDPVIKHCKAVGLTNKEEDKIKIVMVPKYLDGKDGFLNMDYYEVVSASHLGLFPSYYEPWGYTPLESLSYGVPAITSNTAGFGLFLKDKIIGKKKGLQIVDRHRDFEEVVQQLYELLNEYVRYNIHERVSCKMNAHALATYADWRQLIKNYIIVHNKAIVGERTSKESTD